MSNDAAKSIPDRERGKVERPDSIKPRPDSIHVKAITMRHGQTLDLPGRSVPALSADEWTKIEYIPGMRHHLITITPRGAAGGDVVRRFVPETWVTWVPL